MYMYIQDFSLNLFLRQRWLDPRLSFENSSTFTSTLTLNADFRHQIWQPDVYITNEVQPGSFHDTPAPSVLLTLSPQGQVLLSQRRVDIIYMYMYMYTM